MGQTNLGFDTKIRIGQTVATMESVQVEPHVEFFYERVEKVVCGQTRAVGYPRCRWTYPDMELTGEEYYQLKKQVGGNLSASVVIDTPTNDINLATYEPQIASYTAIMHWPEKDVTRIIYNRWTVGDGGILFTNLEPV